jgi:hypothetical protein
VHLLVVVVGIVRVVVLDVVVFVTSIDVEVIGGVVFEVVLVFEELDDELDDDEDDALVLLCEELAGALCAGVDDWLVPSVATCSRRTAGRSPVTGRDLLLSPTPNNAATAAPRNAPTASRNGAPR